MAIFTREEIPIFLEKHRADKAFPVYLFCGDRYLCHEVAEQLVAILLPDPQQRRIQMRAIDGDEEDPQITLNILRTYNLFAARQVIKVWDSRLFSGKGSAKKIWDKARVFWEEGKREESGRQLARFLQHAGGMDIDTAGLALLSVSQWQDSFSFPRPGDLTWLKDITLSPSFSPPPPSGGNMAEVYAEALQRGIPTENIFILFSETVDKKIRLFKVIKDLGAVVDLTVDAGISTQARRDQKELLLDLVKDTLSKFGKKMGADAQEELLNRIGFHPVAIVMETEKLAFFANDKLMITKGDVEEIIGRTREDALFELNEACFSLKAGHGLAIASRLLADGVHPLAIIASFRNQFRKMLLFRSLQDLTQPRYQKNFSFSHFQKYLEELKGAREKAGPLLAGHPYGVFQNFKRAERFSKNMLRQGLQRLLETDYRLKSSAVPEKDLLHDFLYWFFLRAPLID